MKLRQTKSRGSLISLTPLVDVMLILLVFFMVTSTFLDLDMIPVVQNQEQAAPSASPAPGPAGTSRALLIRVRADGSASIRGEAMSRSALSAVLAARAASNPDISVLVLPSGAAPTQALVSVMEAATRAGVRNLRVARLEAR